MSISMMAANHLNSLVLNKLSAIDYNYVRQPSALPQVDLKKIEKFLRLRLNDWQLMVLTNISNDSLPYKYQHYETFRQVGKSTLCLIVVEFLDAIVVTDTTEQRDLLKLRYRSWFESRIMPHQLETDRIVSMPEVITGRPNLGYCPYLFLDEIYTNKEYKREHFQPRLTVEFGSTIDACSELKQLKIENQELRKELNIINKILGKSW